MTEPSGVTISPATITFCLSLFAIIVSGVGVLVAWRQARGNHQARLSQEHGQRFQEMRETYTARIDTLTATVADLQDQVRALQQQNRVLADHAERCEQQLGLLQSRLGFGQLGEGPRG